MVMLSQIQFIFLLLRCVKMAIVHDIAEGTLFSFLSCGTCYLSMFGIRCIMTVE